MTNVIIDVTGNHIIDLYPGEDFFEKIDRETGKGRGDVFQLATQSVPTKTESVLLSGECPDKVARPDYSKATHQIIEEWKWTGRKWKQLR